MPDLRTLHDQIDATLQRLESATDDYGRLADAAARAEATYRRLHAHAIVTLASDARWKRTAAEKEAIALNTCSDEFETYLLARAAADTAKQSTYAIRTRLDALRTLSADVRSFT